MARGEVVTVDGVAYPTKKAATWALHERGIAPAVIASAIGSTVEAVRVAIRSEQRKQGLPPRSTSGAQLTRPAPISIDSSWTESKVDKAVRLYSACLDEVARALVVPRGELEKLWIRGQRPPMAVPEIGDCVDIEPDEAAEIEDAPSRDEDEAELAQLAELEDDDETEEVAAPEAPLPFPAPAPAAPAPSIPSPVAAPSLIPVAGGLYPAGHIVRLKRDDGKYLHESLDGFTADRRFAWDGTRQQFDAVRARMPKLVAKLSFEVVL